MRQLRGSGLAALAVVHFSSSAMMRACDPMLPALARSFGVTTGRAALTISAYAVAYGLTQLLFGPLGDRYGKRSAAHRSRSSRDTSSSNSAHIVREPRRNSHRQHGQ